MKLPTKSIMSRSFSKIFGRDPLSVFFVGTLFTSVLVGIASVPSASAVTIPKTITTCTNIKTGINRLLLKGVCNTKIEKKTTWVKAVGISTIPTPASFTYRVGETGPGGGPIFFVDTKNAYPNFVYLEAAPVDLPAKYAWCSDTSHAIAAVSGKDAWAVGRGQANTTAMLTACTSGAANAAHAYSNNSKIDWFLPSIKELKLMYDNVRGSQGYVANGFPVGYRWSSTGDVDSVAMVQGFFDGFMTSTGINMKSESLFVRPIRAF